MAGSEYYDHSTYPSQGAAGSSSAMRSELESVESGFGKLPDLSGNGSKIVAVNSGGTALEAITTTGTGNGVRATAPTLTAPVLGVATCTSLNGATFTSSTGTWTLTNGKTFTCTNTLTLAGTDGSTLNIGAGGTLGTGAYATIANYATIASPTFTGTVTIPTPFTLGAVSVTSTGTQLNYLNAATGTTGTASSSVVFSASPALSGSPTAPTQSAGDNSTKIATTAYVATAVANAAASVVSDPAYWMGV